MGLFISSQMGLITGLEGDILAQWQGQEALREALSGTPLAEGEKEISQEIPVGLFAPAPSHSFSETSLGVFRYFAAGDGAKSASPIKKAPKSLLSAVKQLKTDRPQLRHIWFLARMAHQKSPGNFPAEVSFEVAVKETFQDGITFSAVYDNSGHIQKIYIQIPHLRHLDALTPDLLLAALLNLPEEKSGTTRVDYNPRVDQPPHVRMIVELYQEWLSEKVEREVWMGEKELLSYSSLARKVEDSVQAKLKSLCGNLARQRGIFRKLEISEKDFDSLYLPEDLVAKLDFGVVLSKCWGRRVGIYFAPIGLKSGVRKNLPPDNPGYRMILYGHPDLFADPVSGPLQQFLGELLVRAKMFGTSLYFDDAYYSGGRMVNTASHDLELKGKEIIRASLASLPFSREQLAAIQQTWLVYQALQQGIGDSEGRAVKEFAHFVLGESPTHAAHIRLPRLSTWKIRVVDLQDDEKFAHTGEELKMSVAHRSLRRWGKNELFNLWMRFLDCCWIDPVINDQRLYWYSIKPVAQLRMARFFEALRDCLSKPAPPANRFQIIGPLAEEAKTPIAAAAKKMDPKTGKALSKKPLWYLFDLPGDFTITEPEIFLLPMEDRFFIGVRGALFMDVSDWAVVLHAMSRLENNAVMFQPKKKKGTERKSQEPWLMNLAYVQSRDEEAKRRYREAFRWFQRQMQIPDDIKPQPGDSPETFTAKKRQFALRFHSDRHLSSDDAPLLHTDEIFSKGWEYLEAMEFFHK